MMEKAVGDNRGPLADDMGSRRQDDVFLHEHEVQSLVDKRKMYLLSEKKVEEFQQTLRRFNETLIKNKVFVKLGVPLKDPADFDIDYALSIAVILGDLNNKPDQMNAFRRFARQFCHKVVSKKNIIGGLIRLAPTDAYGSLISGGFTLILAAMEAHIKLRDVMEQSLDRIPKELNRIKELRNVHIQRNELHRRADDVFVSIFTVLERIIEKLSRKWKENISIKLRNNEDSVEDALESLSRNITEFNDEAELCAQLRMGRMEETGKAIQSTLESMREVMDETSTKASDVGWNLKQMCQKQDIQLEQNRVIINMMNRLYSFVASSPVFNVVGGSVDRSYPSSSEDKDRRKRNGELVNSWLRSLGTFQPSSKDDMALLIDNAQTLALRDQDKVHYIMGCRELQNWLAKPRSSALCVRAETAPEDIINFLSVSTAVMALTFGSSTEVIVLSCFCSLRKKRSLLEQDSGALAVVKSLNGQLLKAILKREPRIDLPFDQDDKAWRRSTESFKHSCSLLGKLIKLLPPGCVVFVLLDSVSRTSGDKSLVDDLAAIILRVARRSPRIVVKLLVTDPLPSFSIWRTANYSLHVPDDVDGWECGINVDSMKSNNALKLRRLESLHIDPPLRNISKMERNSGGTD